MTNYNEHGVMKIKMYARVCIHSVNKLKFIAKLRDVPLAVIIREAVDEYLKKWISGDLDER